MVCKRTSGTKPTGAPKAPEASIAKGKPKVPTRSASKKEEVVEPPYAPLSPRGAPAFHEWANHLANLVSVTAVGIFGHPFPKQSAAAIAKLKETFGVRLATPELSDCLRIIISNAHHVLEWESGRRCDKFNEACVEVTGFPALLSGEPVPDFSWIARGVIEIFNTGVNYCSNEETLASIGHCMMQSAKLLMIEVLPDAFFKSALMTIADCVARHEDIDVPSGYWEKYWE